MKDIKYFLAIFLIAQIAFIFAYYSIGRNQMDLAGDDEDLIPGYSTYMGAINHEILVCSPNQCSYVDDDFFTKFMGEDIDGANSLTFATQIKSVKVDWIINSEEGLLFLKELLR